MNRFVYIIALLLCNAAAVAQSAEAQAGAYLKQHSFEIAQLMQDAAFKKDLKKNALIAVGEVHGNRSSYEVHHQIASRILSQYNLLYLCELDHSMAYFINRYFSTGDAAHLDRIFSRFEGTFFYSKEAAQVYQALYEFLQQNKGAKSIHFAGIDVAHIPSLAIDHLRELTAGNSDALLSRDGAPLHTLLHLQADSIRYSNQGFMAALSAALDHLNNNPEPYRKALGNLFWDTQYVINNLLKTYDIKTADEEQIDRLRDQQMFENLKQIVARRKSGKREKIFFYGGREHVLKAPLEDGEKFVHLADRHLTKGKTLSMYMMYADCMFMIPNEQFGIEGEGVYSQKNFFNDNGPFFGLKDIGLLTGVTEEKSITGFRIWGKKSPFSQHGFFLEQYATTAPTANFYDYIILHRNSEAATPYR